MESSTFDLNKAIELCHRLEDPEVDTWTLRAAQDFWNARDPEAASAFFQSEAEAHPDSALRLYLHGRLHKQVSEAIPLARRVIQLEPDWNFGYRLLMNIYSNSLFRSDSPRPVQQGFEQLLEEDADLFEHVFERTPEAGQLLGYVFEYHLYRRDPDRARDVIKKARKLDQDWALEHDAMLFVRANRGDHKALRKQVNSMVREKIRQGYFSKKEHDKLVIDYLVHYYRFGFAYRHGLVMLEEWLPNAQGNQERADVLFDMARFHTLLEQDDRAFELLSEAADLGFNNLQRATSHTCLEMLRDDPRWDEVLKKFQENWEQDYQTRKNSALSGKIDIPAPNWSLPDENGNTVRLSDLRGDVVVLEFWATYCRPCRKGMPEISEFTRLDAGGNVRVYSINVRNENRNYAKAFKDKRGYKTTILFAGDELAREYGIQSIPVLMVLDPRGHIRFREDGFHFGIRDRLIWWTADLLEEFGMERALDTAAT